MSRAGSDPQSDEPPTADTVSEAGQLIPLLCSGGCANYLMTGLVSRTTSVVAQRIRAVPWGRNNVPGDCPAS